MIAILLNRVLAKQSISQVSNNQQQQCQLCQREMKSLTVHHLVPRQNTKRKKQDPGPTANICSACHRQIHALFDNKLLALELNTLDKLKNEPQMQKFLVWVRKQDPGKRVSVHR
ncbi:HNH endonuclease [Nostoc sp. FACHB-888]|uniref:HNH endonuclease n=1 Tax=Nostoc sp. FACHB-888 TaxID=2692842 RepID=UPI00321F77EB